MEFPRYSIARRALYGQNHIMTFLKISNDIIICVCYIASPNSSSRVHTDSDDLIISHIARLKTLLPIAVFMRGNMNGITGVSPAYMTNDNSRYSSIPDDCVENGENHRANEELIHRVVACLQIVQFVTFVL